MKQILIIFLITNILIAKSETNYRLTDKSDDNKTIKIQISENGPKVFGLGEVFDFYLGSKRHSICEGIISKMEENFLVVNISNISQCWPLEKRLRRGTKIYLSSETLSGKDIETELKGLDLKRKKVNLLTQMNDTNLYLHNFNLKKKKILSEYDQRIKRLKIEKNKALEDLYKERSEMSDLQLMLRYKIEKVQKADNYFRK